MPEGDGDATRRQTGRKRTNVLSSIAASCCPVFASGLKACLIFSIAYRCVDVCAYRGFTFYRRRRGFKSCELSECRDGTVVEMSFANTNVGSSLSEAESNRIQHRRPDCAEMRDEGRSKARQGKAPLMYLPGVVGAAAAAAPAGGGLSFASGLCCMVAGLADVCPWRFGCVGWVVLCCAVFRMRGSGVGGGVEWMVVRGGRGRVGIRHCLSMIFLL